MTKILTLFLAVMASLTTGCATAAHADEGYFCKLSFVPSWSNKPLPSTCEFKTTYERERYDSKMRLSDVGCSGRHLIANGQGVVIVCRDATGLMMWECFDTM